MTAVTTPTPGSGRLAGSAWAQLVLAEARVVLRDPGGLVVPLGFPMLLLVMNGFGAAAQDPIPELGGHRPFDAFVTPLAAVIVVATIGLINVPATLATYRKTGVLRRLAVTPVHPAMLLGATVVVSVAQALLGIALAVGVGMVAFDLSLPSSTGWALASLALVLAAHYALGVLIGAVVPTTNAAIAVGLVLFFLTLAVGGGFGPVADLPRGLALVGEHLPFGAAVQALQASWVGQAPAAGHLWSLGGTALVASAAAARLFRWR